MAIRRAPFVGAAVTVALLAGRVRGTVEQVCDGGRRLLVATEDGAPFTFALSPATGQFVEDGRGVGGARLIFD